MIHVPLQNIAERSWKKVSMHYKGFPGGSEGKEFAL